MNMSMIDVQPSTSHIFGGTTVTLKGTGFIDCGTLQCKFGGGAAVQARFVNATEIECVAPAISELGPHVSRVVETSFDTVSDLLVEGHALVEEGVLKLTRNAPPKLQEPPSKGRPVPVTGSDSRGRRLHQFQPQRPELLVGRYTGSFHRRRLGRRRLLSRLRRASRRGAAEGSRGLTAYGVASNAPFNGLLISFVRGNYLRVEYNGELIGLWEVHANALRTAARLH